MSQFLLAGEKRSDSSAEKAELLREIVLLRSALATCAVRIAALDRLAHVDPLVNLPNRRSFLASAKRTIARVQRHGSAAAVMFLDVDGLKTINDRFGHEAGDKALVKVARLLVESVRDTDLVARFAGDEFGILLEDADELTAWRLALRVVETVDACEFRVGGVCLPLSVAVGVSAVRAGDTPETLIRRADQEMYRIKAIQGATFCPVASPQLAGAGCASSGRCPAA